LYARFNDPKQLKSTYVEYGNPDVFAVILDWYRYGKLYMPPHVNADLVKDQMVVFGILKEDGSWACRSAQSEKKTDTTGHSSMSAPYTSLGHRPLASVPENGLVGRFAISAPSPHRTKRATVSGPASLGPAHRAPSFSSAYAALGGRSVVSVFSRSDESALPSDNLNGPSVEYRPKTAPPSPQTARLPSVSAPGLLGGHPASISSPEPLQSPSHPGLTERSLSMTGLLARPPSCEEKQLQEPMINILKIRPMQSC